MLMSRPPAPGMPYPPPMSLFESGQPPSSAAATTSSPGPASEAADSVAAAAAATKASPYVFSSARTKEPATSIAEGAAGAKPSFALSGRTSLNFSAGQSPSKASDTQQRHVPTGAPSSRLGKFLCAPVLLIVPVFH